MSREVRNASICIGAILLTATVSATLATSGGVMTGGEAIVCIAVTVVCVAVIAWTAWDAYKAGS